MSINGFKTTKGTERYNYDALDNKPAGYTGETLVVCQDITLDALSNGVVAKTATIWAGETITLSINGVSVTEKVKELDNIRYVGNPSLAEPSLENNGEGYLLVLSVAGIELVLLLVSDYAQFGITEEEPDLTQYTATVTAAEKKLLPRRWLEPEEKVASNFKYGCLCYPGTPSSPSGKLSYIDLNGTTFTGLLAATSLWQDMRTSGLVPAFIFKQETTIQLPSTNDYRNVFLAIPMITHIGGPGNFRGVVCDTTSSSGQGKMYYFTIFDGSISFEAVSGS